MTAPERRNLVRDRIVEAGREIGTLLIALSPLDWVLSERSGQLPLLVLFVVGMLLLAVAIAAEWRMDRGQ
jgi:hypothetical protein